MPHAGACPRAGRTYAATKAALLGLTTSLAAELAPGIRVDCVAAEAQEVGEAEMSRVLLGRVAAPAELAAAIVHLALDATYSTGSVVTVAGRLQRPLVAQS